MAWIGLVLGLIIGAIVGEWAGAIALGFLGWIIGFVISSSRKKPAAPSAPAASPTQPLTLNQRLAALEKTVAALEARLANLESGTYPNFAEIGDVPRVDAAPRVPEPSPVEASPAIAPAAGGVASSIDVPPQPTAEVSSSVPQFEEKRVRPGFLAWFLGGNAIVRVGALVLFIGLVFLLNYAREHQLIAPEWRIAGVAAAGIALLALGWRLRMKNTGYAVSLQGAGIAILYLTIFAAMRLYGLVSPEVAFVLLAFMAAASAVIAVAQDSLALAVIGAGGGFLAPILASTGSGNHVALFGYYVILNLGVMAIAWFKAWRSLNVVAFLFTFLIGLAWGVRAYNDELFATTEPFLVAFFLMYVAIAVLFARARPEGAGRYVDGTIVFGTPLAAFGLQSAMLRHTEFGLAYSSLAAAALYLGLATALHRRKSERWALLAESFLALGVVFATLAIPLALDARWTSAAWALEGAAIAWIGVRQQRVLARAFGLLLQLGAGIAYIGASRHMVAEVPIVDAPFLGAMLIALAGILTHRLFAKSGDRITAAEKSLVPVPFLWGLVWLLYAGNHEIRAFVPSEMRIHAHAILFAAIALVFTLLARSRAWPQARWPGYALLPVLWIVALFAFIERPHALGDLGWIAWPFAIGVMAFVLRDVDDRDASNGWHETMHAATFLLVAALGAWEMHWAAVRTTADGTAWSVASVLLVPAMLLLVAVSRKVDERWPIVRHKLAYRAGAVGVVLAAMGVWIIYANATHDGTSDPLPYLPLVNAIDLGHILIAICGVGAWLAWRRSGIPVRETKELLGTAGALTFIWLNGMLLRSLHHWADVPYRLGPMMRSVIVQASISVFWTVIALALMVYATRSARRVLWMTGAVLMGVVVVKLFLVDLEHLSGIERIVAFIVVGLLMLVIGYFSPVPPRRVDERQAEEQHA